MRFRVRKPNGRYRAKQWWHQWYAWYPVRVPSTGKMSGMTLVWLEKIWRKGDPGKWYDDPWTYIYAWENPNNK